MAGASPPSPARNRVTPLGDIEAFALRGAFTGNRGILHDGVEITRFHGHDAWITCALRFKDRWSEQWRPHRFTWLYFHDEAVSFAAITEADVRRAGEPDRETLRRRASHAGPIGEDTLVYRIELHAVSVED
jgi:hypothetical protein